MARKKVTYRPSKAGGAFGMVWGAVFVVIGLVVVIPAAGLFGVIWTLGALGITIMNGYNAFGKSYVGPEIHIEEEGAARREGPSSVEQRLEELKGLYDRDLITHEEYEAKRRDILQDL